VRAVALALLSVAPIWAAPTNYSHRHRPASAVRMVVVHVTEGSYGATISWFRNRKARAAANYVVGRDGRIAHMVPDSLVAWHAGNGYVNAHSIGVENEGYIHVEGTFTDAEYRASARLVATLLRRYRLPADRGHVIGHSEVPDPYHRGSFGGYSHHSDPGPYWDWQRYMQYVRDYRAGTVPPPRTLDVAIPGPALGQTVTGLVPLTAVTTGEPVAHVDFLVDGVVRASVAQPPYTWAWDTALELNGRHVPAVRAVGVDGRVALASVVVDSQTPPPPPPVVTLPELPPLVGVVSLTPAVTGAVSTVELWLDGVVVQTSEAAPWTLTWDTTGLAPGPHTLAVRAVGAGPRGRAAAVIVVVPGPSP